jgi:hypothetical protein
VGRDKAVNVSSTSNIGNNGLYVGGITGFARGTGVGAHVYDCDYRQGIILVNSDTGIVYIGGLVGGGVTPASTIESCYSHAGDIIVNKKGAGNINIGGLIGYYFNGAGGLIKDSFSLNHIVVNTEPGTTGIISAGGFIGSRGGSTTNVSYCYAKGNVSVLGYGAINAGGFIGNDSIGSNITNCYATGNVSAISRGSGDLLMGGFSSSVCNVSNCYSTGGVFADKTGTDNMRVGGFAGQPLGANNMIKNSFATGNVTAQRNSNDRIDVGGFFGFMRYGTTVNDETTVYNTLKNCAALGRSITATGGNPRNAGRVYGREGEVFIVMQNNHAFNGMIVTESATYGAPASVRTDVTLTKGRGEKDGADAHEGNFRDIRFWSNPPPVNTEDPPEEDNSVSFDVTKHGLDFSETHWDFSTVPSRGYPVLRASPNGPRMGGQ